MGFDDRALSDFALAAVRRRGVGRAGGPHRLLRGTAPRGDRPRRGGADRRDLPAEPDHAAHDARVEGRPLRGGRRWIAIWWTSRSGGTHGTEAAMAVARASAMVGFVATSNVEAARRYGLHGRGHHGALVRGGLRQPSGRPSGVRAGSPGARDVPGGHLRHDQRHRHSDRGDRGARADRAPGCASGQRRHRRAVAIGACHARRRRACRPRACSRAEVSTSTR